MTVAQPFRAARRPSRFCTVRAGGEMPSAQVQLAGFLAKFPPEVRKTAKAALAAMRRHMPGAVEHVYRTHALVVGFGPNERPSDALFSVVLYPRHVTLCFLQGALLEDPEK